MQDTQLPICRQRDKLNFFIFLRNAINPPSSSSHGCDISELGEKTPTTLRQRSLAHVTWGSVNREGCLEVVAESEPHLSMPEGPAGF